MIDVQSQNQNTRFLNAAEVYFTDGVSMGPAVVLLEVGEYELAELIVSAIDQMTDQDFEATYAHDCAAFVFQAVATGNRVSLHPAPMRNSFPQQFASLLLPERAIGGVGTVIVDVSRGMVTTYGGRGFNEVAPSNPYQPCAFKFDLLDDMPASGQEPAPEVAARPARKVAAKKKASRKKGGRKKAAARTGDVEV